jgi:uncharacterized protein (TIGR03083 family)
VGLKPLAPIDCSSLILPLHQELLALLRSLSPDDWRKQTVARAWRVRDVVAHLLDGQLRCLSLRRDQLELKPDVPIKDYGELVLWLNQLNADWVKAAARLSPQIMIDMLALTGPQVSEYFSGLDPDQPATFAVAWAGERESPNWFDIGREYTEHWHHQQQIRDAVGKPLLLERRWFHPLADICMRALPHNYANIDAAEGTAIVFRIGADAGGSWSMVRRNNRWELMAGVTPDPNTAVTVDADTAWRIFFKALTPAQASARVSIAGERRLGEVFCSVLAVMA